MSRLAAGVAAMLVAAVAVGHAADISTFAPPVVARPSQAVPDGEASAPPALGGRSLPPPLAFGGNAWIPQGPGPTTNGYLVNIPPYNPVCGAIQAIAAHPTNPDILYIGAVNGGVWRTLNATATNPVWTPLTDSQLSLSMGALEFDPTDPARQTLVAGSGRLSSLGAVGGSRIGVLRTTDGGNTWSMLGSNVFANENLTSVSARSNVIMAASDDTWGGGNGSGLFRSTDTGASWTRVSGGTWTGLPAGPVSDLVGDPGNSNRLYAAVRTGGIYRSDNGGATWTNVTGTITGITGATDKIEMAVHNSGTGNAVYVAIINNSVLSRVYRSPNAGVTWTQMDTPNAHPGQQGDVHFSIAADPTDPNIVYLAGDRLTGPPYTGNLFRGNASLAAGSQFTTIMDANGGGTAPHADSREMMFDANGNLLESDDGGIYRRLSPRSNAGVWVAVVGNLACFEAHDAAYDSVAKVIMIGAQDNGTDLQPSPNAVAWDFINGGDGGDVAIDDLSTPNRSHRYGSSQDLGGFFRFTYDANNQLVSVAFPPLNVAVGSPFFQSQFVTPIVLNKINPVRIMFGGANAAYESFNSGTNITALSPLAGVNASINGGALAYGGRLNGMAAPDIVVYGSGSTVRLRTAAGGTLTQASALPVGGGFVRDLVLDTNDWRRIYVIDSDQVFFTSDAGTNWSDITGNLSGFGSLRSVEFVPLNGTNAVVVGTDRGVFCSFTNAAGVWQRLGVNLPNAPVFDMAYSSRDDVLIVSTLGRGTFKFGPPQNSVDLSVALADSPDPVNAGQNLVYTASVTNLGPNLANGVTLNDVLPAGVLFVSAGASQGSVSQSAGVVVAQLGTLQAGAAATVTIVVKPGVIGALNNTVSVSATELESDPVNNTATATTTVLRPPIQADLRVTLNDSPDPIVGGQPLTFTAVVNNAGPNAATNVLLNDAIPAGVNFVSASASQGTVSLGSGQVTATLGTLSNGASATVIIALRPITPGTLTNSVVVFGNDYDPNVTNNTATTTTTVTQPPLLITSAGSVLVGESFSPPNGAVDVDETVTVEFGLQNFGAASSTNLVGVLLPGNGVGNPGAPQTYGVLTPGATAFQPFTFTATNVPGGIVTARLQVQDGAALLGIFNYTFTLSSVRNGTNTGAITINDNAPATPYPSTITIAGASGTISRATVSLTKFSHTFPDDVDVLLVGPGGQKVILVSDAGGSQSVTNLFLTFDDSAATAAPDGPTLTSGTFKPTDYEPGDAFPAPAPGGPYGTSLGIFNGTDPNGAWSLYVVDDTTGDVGVISGGWVLSLQTVLAVNPPGDLGIGLTAAPSPATAGLPLVYTLVVTNLGSNAANGVVLTDPLPPGVSVLTISPSQGSATNVGATVMCNVGTLAPGASASVTLTAVASVPGVLTNVVTASASQTELSPANNTASVVTTVNAPAPALTAAGVALVAESGGLPNGGLDSGETVTLRFALRNVGTADTTNLVATLLPGGGVSVPGGAQIYGAVAAGGPAVEGQYTFTVGASGGGTVLAALQLQDGAVSLGQVTFSLPVAAAASFTGAPIVINEFGAATPYPSTINLSGLNGLVSRVTVTLSNFSHTFPSDADVLLVGPAGQRVMLMSDAGGSAPASGVTLTFDDTAANLVSAGALSSGTFKPTDYEPGDGLPAPAPAGPYGNQLAAFVGADPNGTWSLFVADDTAGDGGAIAGGWRLSIETVAPINPVADLSVTSVANPEPVVNGSLLIYVVTATNRGPSVATSVLLTNRLPAGAVLLSAAASQGSVQQLGGTVFADLGSLGAGATASVKLSVYPTFSGTATNVSGVAGSEADFALGDNAFTLLTSVTLAPLSTLSGAMPLGGGGFEFALNGQPGLKYVIEYSSNLVDWSPLSTNIPAGGRVVVSDSSVPPAPIRFYRARQLTQ